MRAKHFIIKELGVTAEYTRPIGMMEMYKFRQMATPEELKQMKLLIATDQEAAWRLLEKVTKTRLSTKDNEPVNEIAMSPSRLKQMASQVDATCGIEFEMIVPAEDTEETEYDFEYDRRARTIIDVLQFYGDFNSRGDIEDAKEKITEAYMSWVNEQISNEFSDKKIDIIKEYLLEEELDFYELLEQNLEDMNLSRQEIKLALDIGRKYKDYSENEIERELQDLFKDKRKALENYQKAKHKVDQFVEKLADTAIKEKNELYNTAHNSHFENSIDNYSERDFFEENNLYSMSDFMDYGLTWPYYQESSKTNSIKEISKQFQEAINKPVLYGTDYKSVERDDVSYIVEPDGSIDPMGEEAMGLEFISPPMSLTEMINDLNKVVSWAKSIGAYTNKTTGLHMNVSVSNYSRQNCDYIKLALLLGDEYVLSQFQRETNKYAKSSLNIIRKNILDYQISDMNLINDLLLQMKSNLVNDLKQRLTTYVQAEMSRYVSINMKRNYIEFRSPGGNWLDQDISTLENTLLRFVVALDASCDPMKYRQEYLKKLYLLLKPQSENDIISLFIKFNNKQLNLQELKDFIQTVRKK